MRSDVIDIRDFYAGPLGQTAARIVGRRVRATWTDVRGMTVVGFGFPGPALEPFRGEAARTLSFMPAAQGVLHWPRDGANAAALVEEYDLPLPDLSVDRMVLLHGLETAEALRPLLREVWRVLAGDGRLLVIVPNRRGVWCRLDNTPFGNGQPYSMSQMGRRLRDALFTPLTEARALYVPPTQSGLVLRSADAVEEIGTRWFGRFGGLLMVEATKQLYAGVAELRTERRSRLAPIPATAPLSEETGMSDREEPPAPLRRP